MFSKRLIFYYIVIGAILLNNWLLSILLNRHLLFAGGSVSEFSAATQPHHLIFQVLDIVSGLLFFTGFVALFYKSAGKLWRGVFGTVAVLGLANCVDAILPLPCSGTVDKLCNSPVRINLSRVSLPDHVFSSIIIGTCFVAVPLLVWRIAKKLGERKLAIYSWVAIVLVCLFFGVLVAESFIEKSLLDHLLGFSQELQMLAFGWLIIELTKLSIVPEE